MQRATRNQLCTSFSATNPPVLRVQPGEPFVMETNDRFATYEGPDSSPDAMEILTTMAGPVYIEGAKPGDTLKIEVLAPIPRARERIATAVMPRFFRSTRNP